MQTHLNHSTEIHLDVNLVFLPLWTGWGHHQSGKSNMRSEFCWQHILTPFTRFWIRIRDVFFLLILIFIGLQVEHLLHGSVNVSDTEQDQGVEHWGKTWKEIFMHICKCEMLYLTELLDAILFIRYVHIHSFIKMITTRLTVIWINLNVSIIKQWYCERLHAQQYGTTDPVTIWYSENRSTT